MRVLSLVDMIGRPSGPGMNEKNDERAWGKGASKGGATEGMWSVIGDTSRRSFSSSFSGRCLLFVVCSHCFHLLVFCFFEKSMFSEMTKAIRWFEATIAWAASTARGEVDRVM